MERVSNRSQPSVSVKQLIDRAIEEDQVLDDVTTRHMVPENLEGTGVISARESGVLAGTFLLSLLYEQLPGDVRVSAVEDGTRFSEGDDIARIQGPVRTILSGERAALNFLQRLTGVATLTNTFVERVADRDAEILDTRKTTPGWRTLEKYAVRVGGGRNHRMNMSEMALVKENHLVAMEHGDEELPELVDRLKSSVRVQMEASTQEELERVLACDPHLVLLDNMTVEETERAVERIRSYEDEQDREVLIESSGGIDLDHAAAYADAGVDRISIGAVTHSAPAVDLSLNLRVPS